MIFFSSHNVQMFFPDVDPSLDFSQLESHPVLSKLKAIEKENGFDTFKFIATIHNIVVCIRL